MAPATLVELHILKHNLLAPQTQTTSSQAYAVYEACLTLSMTPSERCTESYLAIDSCSDFLGVCLFLSLVLQLHLPV